ncbi:SpoIIE family protein phosphatase [Microscilla marina]|uniref:Serine/threonine protein kinases, putative n=1 Tax=Microscilla marina ATCC 23134 TaxID=313606 RepID=A1ZZK2_MICM2|nr:SpoIIE family protein phosphatase [Microscilla marina]EAY24197.1 serine/threonine protein kinases, putative [Microscilla marina ATCC 23134]
MANILVLDKDPLFIHQINRLADSKAYDFTYVNTPRQLFDQLAKGMFPVLMLDLGILGAQAVQVVRQIKTNVHYKETDIILLTKNRESSSLADCLQAGACDFITKPTRNLVLHARIKSIVRSQVYQYEIEEKRRLLENKTQKLADVSQVLKQQTSDLQQVNRNILNSIEYASNIQAAVLPHPEEIKKSLPDSFIFFKPRDIVSGDFYWFREVGDKIVVAAIDCTGHGVPGAFLAILGDSVLSRIIHYHQILHADEILNEIHVNIQRTLRQNETTSYDGMDMALCVIDKTNKKIQFAGAHNPLVYVQDGELCQIKGDKVAVGGAQWDWEKGPRVFKKHEIDYANSQSLSLYMFSDGYQDQFGGKKIKKFQRKNFRNLLHSVHDQPAAEQKRVLDQTLTDWINEGNQEQVDDILVIGVKL